jgi:predicted aspartyl protease
MKMLTRRILPLALTAALGGLLAEPEVAVAQIFRWLDAEGAIHYSQGVDSVPERFRGSAVIIGYDRPASPAEPSPGSARVPPSGTGEIKFTPGQPIMVTARINGAGSAQLMLDTGAVRTVINPAVLATLGVSYENAQRGTLKGVTGDAEVQAVRVDSIEVSGARYGPLLVVSHDTGFGPGRGDGLLGRDFLDNFTVTIDNATGTLTLTSK